MVQYMVLYGNSAMNVWCTDYCNEVISNLNLTLINVICVFEIAEGI